MSSSSEAVTNESVDANPESESTADVMELFHESRAQTDPDGFVSGELVSVTHDTAIRHNLLRCDFQLTIEDPWGDTFTVRIGSNWGHPKRRVARYLQYKEQGSEIKFREVDENSIQLKEIPNSHYVIDTVTESGIPNETQDLLEKAGSDDLGLPVTISVDPEPTIIEGDKYIRLSAELYAEQTGEWFLKLPSSINLEDPQADLERLLSAYDCNSLEMLDESTVTVCYFERLASSVEQITDENHTWSIVLPQNQEQKTQTLIGRITNFFSIL